MAAQTLIQVRVDKPLKDEVSEVFASLGLDVSTAIRIFLQRCWAVKGIPFDLKLSESERVRAGISKGKWKLDAAWYEKDREQDAALAKDFYADSL